MLTDGQWAALEPLVETYRPPAKVAPQNLRQTMSAIRWRHQNGAKWRAVPEVLGPWWKAAQTFIRWSRLGVWERLLLLVQKDGSVSSRASVLMLDVEHAVNHAFCMMLSASRAPLAKRERRRDAVTI